MPRGTNPQRDKRTKAVKTAAAGSASVPVLRQVVMDLCDVVDNLDERLALLERAPQARSGPVR